MELSNEVIYINKSIQINKITNNNERKTHNYYYSYTYRDYFEYKFHYIFHYIEFI